jgi:hypothetical protein
MPCEKDDGYMRKEVRRIDSKSSRTAGFIGM